MFQSAADKLHISALNFAEIAVFPVKNGAEDEFFAGIGGLELKVDSVGVADTLDLTKLRVDTALRMTDVCAIQLAAKLDGILATTDKAVAKAAKSLGIEVFQP
jgi:predicted nucleic acid-binding protein